MSSASAQVHSLPAHVAQFHKDAPPSLAISARDLPERLSLAGAGQTVKGMLCNAALQAVSTLLDRRAAETCRAASGERRFIDFFSYPVSSFLRLSFTAAELSRSKLGGYDAAFRTLGKQAVDDFLSTAVGKTLRSLGSRDPHRLLATLPSTYRSVVNHGDRFVQLASEGRCLLRMRRDFLPHPYHEGVLSSLLFAVGLGSSIRVSGRRVGVLDADYEIVWD
ncbi:MAG TPA: TIGR02265 family protein [Myxococcales bacterium]|jgi:uncharacterized protein (TIGR02265 family)|nr:TIGR02265 family protein [Myxococcales bacterium]